MSNQRFLLDRKYDFYIAKLDDPQPGFSIPFYIKDMDSLLRGIPLLC